MPTSDQNIKLIPDDVAKALADSVAKSAKIRAEIAKEQAADPCHDAGVAWYSSCRATMQDAQQHLAKELPPPEFNAIPLIVLIALGGLGWLVVSRRHSIASFSSRWIMQPVARKSARAAANFKSWWLED